MEIIDMSNGEPNEFRLLELGAVFQTESGTFIKCSIGQVGVNAVNLKNGAPAQFVLRAEVKPVRAKLVINEPDSVKSPAQEFEEEDLEF